METISRNISVHKTLEIIKFLPANKRYYSVYPPFFLVPLSPMFLSQSMNLDQMDPKIAGGRKFKWLREKKGVSSQRATLQSQIKNFILMDEVNVKSLLKTLQRQVRVSDQDHLCPVRMTLCFSIIHFP